VDQNMLRCQDGASESAASDGLADMEFEQAVEQCQQACDEFSGVDPQPVKAQL
jgi:hypothetical protein